MNLRVWLRALAGSLLRRKRLEELRAAVAAHLGVLPVASAQLRDTNRQVEEAVTQVGTSFQRMVESARAGASQASRLVNAGGGSADGPAVGVGDLLSSSGATLEDLLVRIVRDGEVCRQLIGSMGALERDMARIVRALGDVDRISFGNTILALNAKIEAAHVGERGQGFELVAQELWQQSQRSERITEEIRSTILRVAGDAKTAVGEIGGMACADAVRTEALQAQVRGALDRLRRAHEETGRALAEGEAGNQALVAEVAAAVQAMQFQDRVSQQVAHIVDALESMQAAIAVPLGSAHDSGVGGPAVADLLSRSYTMEAERSVHAAVLGRERVTPNPLDDVEIF